MSKRVPSLGPELRRMIWPLGPEEFLERYWEQRHFVSHGPARRAEPILEALSARSIEEYLQRRQGAVQIWYQTLEGNYGSMHAEPRDALGLYRTGLTVFIDRVDELRPWKAVLGRQLGFEDTGAAALFGARRGGGTRWHFDHLENFTVQLSGSKRWRIAANRQVPNPLKNWVTRMPIGEEMRTHVTDLLPGDAPPGRIETIDLEPGSVLYLPRGYWHTARASSGASLSVTFLYQPMTWASRFIAALQDQLAAQPMWREHAGEVLGDRRDDAAARAKVGVLLANLRAVVSRLAPEDFVPGDQPPPRLTARSALSRNPLAFLTVEVAGRTGTVRLSVRAARPRTFELEIDATLAPVCVFVSRQAGSFLASEAAAAAPEASFARVATLLRMLWKAGVLRRG